MPGFSTVVSDIASDLDRGSDFHARIRVAVQRAIQFYRSKRFGFNEARTTFTNSSEYRSLSVAWLEIDSLRVQDTGGHWRPLLEKSFGYIEQEARDPDHTDEPVYYAVYGRQVRFYPAPDATYSFQLAYLADLTEVSASASDSASNGWLNEGLELVRCRAMVELLEVYIDGPEAMAKADRLRLREQQELTQLKRRANREQGGGMVEPWI
jgi:hypothetical protein